MHGNEVPETRCCHIRIRKRKRRGRREGLQASGGHLSTAASMGPADPILLVFLPGRVEQRMGAVDVTTRCNQSEMIQHLPILAVGWLFSLKAGWQDRSKASS